MRLLIDNALSPIVAKVLSDAGHDAVHVRDIHLQHAEDPLIFDRAGQENRVLVSADTDFATILAQRQVSQPSVILLRRTSRRRPADQGRLLLANIPTMKQALADGSLVVIEEARLRIRELPIGAAPQ